MYNSSSSPERQTTESDFCKRPLNTTEEDREGRQEVTATLAAAKEISVVAAVAVVLLELDGILTSKENKDGHTRLFTTADWFWQKFSLTLRLIVASRVRKAVSYFNRQ